MKQLKLFLNTSILLFRQHAKLKRFLTTFPRATDITLFHEIAKVKRALSLHVTNLIGHDEKCFFLEGIILFLSSYSTVILILIIKYKNNTTEKKSHLK